MRGFRGLRAAWRLHTWIGLSALVLAGCQIPKKGFRCEAPPPIHLTILAGENLNPSDRGEPLPTRVKILQVSNLTKVDSLESKDFWDKAADKLGADLLFQEDLTIDPGERNARWVNRLGPTNYIVAGALFRKPEGYSWRAVVSLLPVSEVDCPLEAPPPRLGEPLPKDTMVVFSLQRFTIDGSVVGAKR